MDDLGSCAEEHINLTRRSFLRLGVAGAFGVGALRLWRQAPAGSALLDEAIAKLDYLTRPEEVREFGRETPRIDQLPLDKRRQAGLHPDTWQLEVVADEESGCEVERPLSKESGTALTWKELMRLAEKYAVRFLHVLTCTNMTEPMGMGLWEGVPLREIIWMARPKRNVRRLYYWGYHNDDSKQSFQSSLSVGRVLEDPPGELPVILCHKLNGQWLSPKGGAPVRMVVPGRYGNKWVKWVQRIVLTNDYRANDTYAEWNNDVETHMKTQARFIQPPERVKVDQSVPLVGFAQVGMSGFSKVQYSLQSEDATVSPDDPFFTRLDWKDAEILPPPKNWGGGLPDGKLPPIPLQFDVGTGKPYSWPLRYTIVHWAAMLNVRRAGQYRLRCRTIDANDIAQPMPRPFPKSGNNAIHDVPLIVEA
jgi:DMSO/TMAO reductase YedYZ molybdopterin-dependent catalytic subunit